MHGATAGELARVMHGIAGMMQARGAALILDPEDGSPPRLLHFDEDAGLPCDMPARLLAELRRTRAAAGAHVWLDPADGARAFDALRLSLPSAEHDGRLTIDIFYDALTPERRREIEAICLGRCALATDYLRLWQLDGACRRRVAGLEAALGFLDLGVLLLDRSARIVFANPTASALLETQAGIRRHHGRLMATDLESGIRLQVAIDHVVVEGGAAFAPRRVPLLTLDRRTGRALVASVLPLPDEAREAADAAAIVYLVDPAVDVDRMLYPICRLYSLSPLETRLACLLASGATLAEAAVRMNVKDQTVRGSLKRIFVKTGTHRQPDLIRILLTSIVRTNGSVMPEVL